MSGIFSQPDSGQHPAYKRGWKLTFYDEFDSSAVNYSAWRNSFPWGRWTGGLHYMTDRQNLTVNNHNLNIRIDNDSLTGVVDAWDSLGNYTPYSRHFDYTSGMIYSKKSFLNGYFECRFKVPAVKGLNSAFWLYGPENSEIDVFEIKGSRPFEGRMSLHWKDTDPLINSSQWGTTAYCDDSTFAEIFQTFAVKWMPNELKWYLNDNEIIESAFTYDIRGRHIPVDSMNIIVTAEVGTLDGNPDSTSVFPAYLYIDYIRAYSSDTTPAPVITGQIPLDVSFGNPLAITTGMLTVTDFFHVYPAGFKVDVQPGLNYAINGNAVTPLYDYIDTLYVPVRVDDGIDESPLFQLKVKVTPANHITPVHSLDNASVYPNPVVDKVNIAIRDQGECICQLTVYDINGCKLILQTGSSALLDLSVLDAGIYFIGILTNKSSHIEMIMKE